MAIIGILMALAYPSYAAHLLRARRLEGKAALFEAMHHEETEFTRGNRYVAWSADATSGANADGQGSVKWWSGASAPVSAYELHAQPCGDADLASCVELVATPGTERVDVRFHDRDCGALILSSTGERRAESGDQACWR